MVAFFQPIDNINNYYYSHQLRLHLIGKILVKYDRPCEQKTFTNIQISSLSQIIMWETRL